MSEIQVIRDTYVVTAAEVAAANFWGRAFRPGEAVTTYIDALVPVTFAPQRWKIRDCVTCVVNANGTRKQGVFTAFEAFNDRQSGTVLVGYDVQCFGEFNRIRDVWVDYGLLVVMRPGACIAGDLLSTVLCYEVVKL